MSFAHTQASYGEPQMPPVAHRQLAIIMDALAADPFLLGWVFQEVLARHLSHEQTTMAGNPYQPLPPRHFEPFAQMHCGDRFFPPVATGRCHPVNAFARAAMDQDAVSMLADSMQHASLSGGPLVSAVHPSSHGGFSSVSGAASMNISPPIDVPQAITADAGSTLGPWAEHWDPPPSRPGRGLPEDFLPHTEELPLSPPSFELMDQGPYRGGRFPVGDIAAQPILFNGGNGVPLSDLEALDGGNDAAFPADASIGAKVSIRLQLTQGPDVVPLQVRVRHGEGKRGKKGRPFTVGEMAALIKLELNKLVEQYGQFVHRGRRVDTDDIILVRIEHVSKGSIQPTLAVRGGN